MKLRPLHDSRAPTGAKSNALASCRQGMRPAARLTKAGQEIISAT